MRVINVCNVVVVIVWIKIVHQAIRVVITGPRELVNSTIVVIVFVKASSSRTVIVLVGHSIVVVIERVLVSEIKCANLYIGPRVNGRGRDESICRDISWVEPLRFQCVIIDRSLENSIVVIIVVVNIEDSIVVVIERVCTIASVKALNEIVDSIVVVIKIVQVADSVVVVVILVGFFDKEIVGSHNRFNCC